VQPAEYTKQIAMTEGLQSVPLVTLAL
jgi:hypothetical protein